MTQHCTARHGLGRRSIRRDTGVGEGGGGAPDMVCKAGEGGGCSPNNLGQQQLMISVVLLQHEHIVGSMRPGPTPAPSHKQQLDQ